MSPGILIVKTIVNLSVSRFELREEDPHFHYKLNASYFKKRALEKLNQIQSYYSDSSSNCKLIYIRLVTL